MKKSWYSKNLDIYKILSIKIYSLETKIKNQDNNLNTREKPSSTRSTSLFHPKMILFLHTVPILRLKSLLTIATEKAVYKSAKRT